MEAELRKDSVKGCENNDNLSLRMKSNGEKVGCDELVEKLKIRQRIFPPLRESIREADVDTWGIEEEINYKSKFDIRRKEI